MLKEYKGELLFLVIAMGAYVFMATLNISQNYAYFAVVFGIFGLFVAWKIYEKVDEASDGNEKMREIAESIHEGAMVFLSREYKMLGYFIAAVFILLMIVISSQKGILGRFLDISFICHWCWLLYARRIFWNECSYISKCTHSPSSF